MNFRAADWKFCCLLAVALQRPVQAEEHRAPWFGSSPAASPRTAPLAMPATIRVRILHARRSFTLGCTGPFDFMSLGGGKVHASDKTLTVSPGKGQFMVGGTSFSNDVLAAPMKPSDYLTVNRRRYRGAILIEPAGRNQLDVVEQLAMEDYLYGVLPREVGGDWPVEALKAQAVVSRTYVLANMATDPRQRFDVSNDVYSQVYGGLEDEVQKANEAVEQTRGEVLLTKAGKPLEAFFHSSCGGRTEVPRYVWKNHDNSDDFSSVSDSYCREDPFYHWHFDISADRLRAKLRRAGVRVGEISKVKALKKTPSDRVWVFGIYGSSGNREITGQNFRMAVGPELLRSTRLTDISRTKHGFHFEGRGWGHGVGLCQWGAKGRAQAGQNYQEILKAYYPNASLVRAP